MFVAFDENRQRIYADDFTKTSKCFCMICGEQLIYRNGGHNKAHFAHRKGSPCSYECEHEGPWHLYMKSFFPKESWEWVFRDAEGKVRHVADVYLQEQNTVLEFQHSDISFDDFSRRTLFHLNNGRNIVWIFDESSPKRKKPYLVKDSGCSVDELHQELSYLWTHHSRSNLSDFLRDGWIDNIRGLSICLYYHENNEQDKIRRIVHQTQKFSKINLSVHPITLCEGLNYEEFFWPDQYLLHPQPTILVRKKAISSAHTKNSQRRGPLERSIKR